eukprot:4107592-Prymnesium_polylepis.1
MTEPSAYSDTLIFFACASAAGARACASERVRAGCSMAGRGGGARVPDTARQRIARPSTRQPRRDNGVPAHLLAPHRVVGGALDGVRLLGRLHPRQVDQVELAVPLAALRGTCGKPATVERAAAARAAARAAAHTT